MTLDLAYCTGSETIYKSFLGLRYTEGVKMMAEQGKAYWLIDAIASYQMERKIRTNPRLQEFQLWTLKKNKTGNGATLTCKEDSGKEFKPIVRQRIEYTDFPANEFTLYVESGVLLLPQEH